MRGTNPACQAKNAYDLARAADWYLMQGGYDANAQPLKGLEIRFRSEPIKRPRGVDMVHHRAARAYCKDKFGVNISADTARECLREFLVLERRLTGKKREFAPASAKATRSRKRRVSPYRARRRVGGGANAKKAQTAQWIWNAYRRDEIED